MPQTKQTPFEIVKQYFVDFPEPTVNPHGLGSTIFLIALRDLLRDHAALIEAHDALVDQVLDLREAVDGLALANAEYREKLDLPTGSMERLARLDKSPLSKVSEGAPIEVHRSIPPENGHGLRFTVPDLDYIYKFVKARAEKDSAILELLTRRPELRIKIERQTVQMDDSQLIGRIARLLHEGWFAQPKNGPAVQKELKRRGCEQPTTNLYKPLNKLTEMGFLTLESDGYQEVAEMKALVQKA